MPQHEKSIRYGVSTLLMVIKEGLAKNSWEAIPSERSFRFGESPFLQVI